MNKPIDTDEENESAITPQEESRRLRSAIIALCVTVLAAPFAAMGLAYAMIAPNSRHVLTQDAAKTKGIRVGYVLGAGVAPDGKPYKELQGRLDVAADALHSGIVQRLVLSGDNRFDHYDEPQAMINYQVEQHNIDKAKLQPDFAGRSTYESCERAAKVFKLNKVILISAGSHLPRAVFLCRHFGIEAYGLASSVEADNSWRREQLARVKAIYNAYLVGEPTILGDSITVD